MQPQKACLEFRLASIVTSPYLRQDNTKTNKKRRKGCFKFSEDYLLLLCVMSQWFTEPTGRPFVSGQDCANSKEDFHTAQCSLYDKKPFRGWYMRWRPYNKLYDGNSLSQHCSSSTHRHSIVPHQLIVTALFLINSSSQYCSSSTHRHSIVPLRLIGTALFLFDSSAQHCSSSTHRHSIVPLQLIVTALFLINSSSQYCSSSTHRHSIVPHQLIVTALFLFNSVHGRFTLFQFLLTTC